MILLDDEYHVSGLHGKISTMLVERKHLALQLCELSLLVARGLGQELPSSGRAEILSRFGRELSDQKLCRRETREVLRAQRHRVVELEDWNAKGGSKQLGVGKR